MRLKWLLVSGLFGVGILLLPFSYSSYTYYSDSDPPKNLTLNVAEAQSETDSPWSLAVIWQQITRQVDGVLDFAAQAIQAVGDAPQELFDVVSNDPPESAADVQGVDPFIAGNGQLPAIPSPQVYDGTLIVNVPLQISDQLSVGGSTQLNDLFVAGEFSITDLDVPGLGTFGAIAAGNTQVSSLAVSGNTELNTLSVTGPVSFANLTAGNLTVTDSLVAQSGLTTQGADIDLQGGNIFAANVINNLVAGDNIEIDFTNPNAPVITADVRRVSLGSRVRRLNDLTNSVTLVGGSGISVTTGADTITIANTSGLGTYLGLTDTPSSYLANAIPFVTATGSALTQSSNLTFNGTQLTIGSTSPVSLLTVEGDISMLGQSEARWYDSGNTNYVGLQASSTLATTTVWTLPASDGSANDLLVTDGIGNLRFVNASLFGAVSELNDLSDVTLTATTTGDILRFNGSVWVNATSGALGLGDGTYLGLSDTPSSYTTNAVVTANSAGTALTQSSNFTFDGTSVVIGSATAVTPLTVAGNASILSQLALRFYEPTNTSYVGFRASSSIASSTVWTLPAVDGSANQILVTDGAGTLRFADVSAIGGGATTYLQLTDTPSSFIANAIPYSSTSSDSLLFSSAFGFDGSNLYLGATAATDRLTVHGGAFFGANASTPGLTYDSGANNVGVGTDTPDERLTIEGGSVVQRGAATGDTYSPTQVGSVNLADTNNDAFIVGSLAYTVSSGSGDDFHVIDISDRTNPVEVGSVGLPASANDLYVSGNFAYVVTDVTGNDFHIIDVSDPSSPQTMGSVNLASSAFGVDVQGRYAYVTTADTGDDFHIIDISDPNNPVEVGSANLPINANEVTVAGDYAYVVTDASSAGFHVFNISNSTNPIEVGSTTLPATANDVEVRGARAYVATGSAGDDFHIIDISDPTAPASVTSLNLITGANDLSIAGSYAYVTTAGTGDDIHVIDISSSTNPVAVGSEEVTAGTAVSVAVVGRYGYITSSSVGDDFLVFDMTGIEAQTMLAHSLESGTLSVLGDIIAGGDVTLSEGLRVGMGGVQTEGALLIQSASTSVFIGDLAVGTSSAPQSLTVDGTALITGFLFDSNYATGTDGELLVANSVGQVWRATSSLGLSSAFTTSAQLAALISDETGTAGNLVFSGSPTLTGTVAANALTASATISLLGSAANIALGSNFLSGDGGDEGVFVSSTGLVGIATSAPATELTVDGTIRATNLLGGATGVSTDAQGNIIRDPSDINLKTNVTDIENALETVLALRGVRYQWIDTERFGSQTEVGFIAQEVDLILPEVVRKGGDYWSLNTRNMVAVVVEAFQELWEMVTGNQEKIDTLEGRIEYLETLLDVEPELPTDEEGDEAEDETEPPEEPEVDEEESETELELDDDEEESTASTSDESASSTTTTEEETHGESEIDDDDESSEPDSSEEPEENTEEEPTTDTTPLEEEETDLGTETESESTETEETESGEQENA